MTTNDLLLEGRSEESLHQVLINLANKLYSPDDMLVLQSILDMRKRAYQGLDVANNTGQKDSGVEMAIILLESQADVMATSAALLYCLYINNLLTGAFLDDIDPTIVLVMNGAKQMSIIRTFQNSRAGSEQIESYRKMLLSIIRDVRIVLVKLSEQICLIRLCTVKNLHNDSSKKIANEIIDIYAPLANRLGLYRIKRELEDRSLYILEPYQYNCIQEKLNFQGKNRNIELERFIKKIKVELINNEVAATVSGRVKNIYSIWKKMHKKSYGLHQLFDISAVRILVETVTQCYKVLSIIHENWKSISSEYSDYIANPKLNGYQSIHTVVFGVHQTAIEVQIRTFAMHERSEHGVAAHWRYKEGVKQDKSYESKIIWLKALLEWQKNVGDVGNQPSDVNEKILDGRIYAFTPNGDVIDMPSGSTVLDFAYNIHTMVGHRCKGAKVNGDIVTLKQKVFTGDKVQIITGNEPSPSRDWMNLGSGYILSSKIRARIARWFKSQYKEENAKLGKEKLLLQCSDLNFKSINFSDVAKHFNFQDQESLFSAVYLGDIKLNQVVNYLKQSGENSEKSEFLNKTLVLNEDKFKKNSVVIVHGVDGLLSSIARCCKPVLGDDISGYVTKDKGVSIHRSSCRNFLRMKAGIPERVIEVQWGKENTTKFLVDIIVEYYSGVGALKSIYNLLSSQNITLVSLKKVSEGGSTMASIRIAVIDLDNIVMLLSKIKNIKSVEAVYRV